jgi:hypothetical protein
VFMTFRCKGGRVVTVVLHKRNHRASQAEAAEATDAKLSSGSVAVDGNAHAAACPVQERFASDGLVPTTLSGGSGKNVAALQFDGFQGGKTESHDQLERRNALLTCFLQHFQQSSYSGAIYISFVSPLLATASDAVRLESSMVLDERTFVLLLCSKQVFLPCAQANKCRCMSGGVQQMLWFHRRCRLQCMLHPPAVQCTALVPVRHATRAANRMILHSSSVMVHGAYSYSTFVATCSSVLETAPTGRVAACERDFIGRERLQGRVLHVRAPWPHRVARGMCYIPRRYGSPRAQWLTCAAGAWHTVTLVNVLKHKRD